MVKGMLLSGGKHSRLRGCTGSASAAGTGACHGVSTRRKTSRIGRERGEELGSKPEKQKAGGGERAWMMRGGCRALYRRMRTLDVTLSEVKSTGGFWAQKQLDLHSNRTTLAAVWQISLEGIQGCCYSFFFKKNIFVYLAAPDLICSTWDIQSCLFPIFRLYCISVVQTDFVVTVYVLSLHVLYF